jgi:hypothetical protein
MKSILIMSLVTLLGIAGCTECSRHISSSESIECQRLKDLFNNLEKDDIETVLFFAKDGNEPVDEATLEEFEEGILYLAGCCACRPHPLAKEWMECNRLECIWKHLESENVQRLAFYGQVLEEDTERPEDWYNLSTEITEPEKIKEVLRLLCKAMKKERDKFANEDTIAGDIARMQITTDKHKFIIPISCYRKAVRGIGWTSYELRKQLNKWGFSDAY